ncbi:MAG: hypothetical protein H8D23_19910 [Candidatus Brocadiales bacterium]|nr:hypothetical protein [Candidatus Brocadiales bacterium]
MKNTIINTSSTLFLVIVTLLLFGCGPSADSRYDSGYSDGYAEGYNTTCKIRSTLVEGDWEDENYSRGYQDGRADGAADCKAGK